MFILVRHAHAGDKRAWPYADADRPISSAGREESAGLTLALGGMPLGQLLSSPYRRCRQTLLPLAAVTGLPVQECDQLLPDADPDAFDRLITGAHQGSVFCTHGETLAGLLDRWHRRGFLAGADPPATPKGAAWIVTTTTGTGRNLQYLPPIRLTNPAQPSSQAAPLT